MPPNEARRQFIKLLDSICHHHRRLSVFEDFLEMSALALRKKTVSPEKGEDIERRYMEVVKRHEPDDVRKMPELLALVGLGLNPPTDFFGGAATEMELLNSRVGQVLTPWNISSMMARMVLTQTGIGDAVKERGFLTLCEPACGAGGMVLAAAEVFREEGFEPSRQLFVHATDIDRMAFNMCYVQLALSGIPALVVHGDSLRLTVFEQAFTPAFFPFYQANRAEFDKWWAEKPAPAARPVAEPAPQPKPKKAVIRQPPARDDTTNAQFSLF